MKEITEKTYYTLKDKVTKIKNMKVAAKHVLDKGGSAGVDRIDTVEFKENYSVHMRELYREFLEDRYQPKPALRLFIPKSDGRKRPLGIPPEKGTPQGGVISPLLANIFLHEFDKVMVERGYKLVRFADDFVVMTKSKRKAKRAYEVVKEIITGKLNGLSPLEFRDLAA